MSVHEDAKNGVVAMHRWFSDGEGWAYHPWYESRKRELLAALTPELESRRHLEMTGGRRSFEYPAMGGYLIGEQIKDVNCPDSKAIERYPTILRAAFFQTLPESGRRMIIEKELVGIDAFTVGPDSALKVSDRGAMPASPKAPIKSKRGLILIATALAIIAVSMLVMQTLFQTPNDHHDKELQVAGEKMNDMLVKWHVEGLDKIDKNGPKRAFQISDQFFLFLSHEQVKGAAGAADGDHPDVHFLRRLPEKPSSPRSLAELRLQLEKLLARLRADSQVREPERKEIGGPKALTALLGEIEQEMNFITWWNRNVNRLNYTLGKEANAPISAKARYFISDKSIDRVNKSWQEPVAQAMVAKLSKLWKVKAVTADDAKTRPWFVFHCFFQFLSQHHFGQDDLRVESWHAEFVRRLPKKPLSEFGYFNKENDLVDQLRDLAGRLRAEKSDVPITLIDNIAASLNYDDWKRRAESVISRDTEVGSPFVEHFVLRFKQGQSDGP